MINWFLDTFSIPIEYQKKSNWNTKEIEDKNFSPMANDAGDFAEGNKPTYLIIENEAIKVSSWQDVFIKFLKFLKNNNSYDFQFILDNQVELFRKDDTIIKWSSLEVLIDQNYDLSNRYKTFEGKVWDKVKELSENELFIHINISASTCMTRVANIMNKFNMQEDSVEIVLK